MDFNESIREVVPWMGKNYGCSPESSLKCKEVLHKLILELEGKELSSQFLYLQYYLMESTALQEERETHQFFASLFPIPLKKNISQFMSRLVSLAVCLSNRQVLTASALYLEKEQIKLPEDIEELPLNLAEKSPTFAAVLLDKGSFNITKPLSSKFKDLYSPQLLTQWLVDLNRLPLNEKLAFNGQSLIRYSLLGQGQFHSQLHINILQAIERKRLQPLSNQFIIDLGTQLSNRKEATSPLAEKLAHILVVGAQNGICNTLLSSNQMKNSLLSLFPNNILVKAILSLSR